MGLISRKQMLKQMEDPQPFSLKYRTKSGELIHADDVVSTSINHKNKTVNLRHKVSGEVRTVRHILIVEFKSMEVYI